MIGLSFIGVYSGDPPLRTTTNILGVRVRQTHKPYRNADMSVLGVPLCKHVIPHLVLGAAKDYCRYTKALLNALSICRGYYCGGE